MRRVSYGRPINPLGVCKHCGVVGRIWEYGAEAPGEQQYICAACIEAILNQPPPDKPKRPRLTDKPQ